MVNFILPHGSTIDIIQEKIGRIRYTIKQKSTNILRKKHLTAGSVYNSDVASTRKNKYKYKYLSCKYKYKYSSCKHEYKYKYLNCKYKYLSCTYEYKYKYLSCKYKYTHKYLGHEYK